MDITYQILRAKALRTRRGDLKLDFVEFRASDYLYPLGKVY
jgi:hypothetical protein